MKAPAVSQAVRTAFDRLMTAYPARGDNPRAPALAVFARLVAAGEDAEALVRAAGRFSEVMKAEAREARMIPHTRTWLSQRRFDDYLTDAPASAPATGPNPEHPLFWLAAEIGEAAWLSYIGPLKVEPLFEGATQSVQITSPTAFALHRVRRDWGLRIEVQYSHVVWGVRP